VVTCDRIVARITSKYPVDGEEPSIIPLGSRFENLRIAGHRIEPVLAIDAFCEHDTFTKLAKAHASDQGFRDEFRKLSFGRSDATELPAHKGLVGCTLVRNLEKLASSLKPQGLGINVPHFGTVFLGEFFITSTSRRLLMLRIELGCTVEGDFGAGGAQGNGSPPPPTR
jgi:hypothetical protein